MFESTASLTAQLDESLRPSVVETSLERASQFDSVGTEVWAKREDLQVTGSFKFRGASAKISGLSGAELTAGVIAASTGNHGLAVATAAAAAGAAATIYVSDAADQSKVAKIEGAGAAIEVVPGDPLRAEVAARRQAEEKGLVFVSPYNDPTVVAGQGTIGSELLRQLPGIESVIVSVGGGGLISGIAATVKAHRADIRVIAASAANSAEMHHSVLAGHQVEVEHSPTLSDGTAGGVEAGAITFEICRELVDEWLLIDEEAIAAAMRSYHAATAAVIEGSAGVALAATQHVSNGGLTAVVICGGNISADTAARVGIA